MPIENILTACSNVKLIGDNVLENLAPSPHRIMRRNPVKRNLVPFWSHRMFLNYCLPFNFAIYIAYREGKKVN